jgi:hypothetical protein
LKVVEFPRANDCSDHFHRFGIVIRWIARFARAYAPYLSISKACVQSAGSMPAPKPAKKGPLRRERRHSYLLRAQNWGDGIQRATKQGIVTATC